MRVVVLGACCSGKSTLRERLSLDHPNVIECDDAVMQAAGGSWPASAEENHRLVIETAGWAIAMTDVIFLTSWVPTDLLDAARDRGFSVALLSVPKAELERRNHDRLARGGYSDVAHWFDHQLENHAELSRLGLIDVVLDGTRPPAEVASRIADLAH